MEFFDKLSQKASDVYKGAADKTNKMARESKLKSKINQNKSAIESLYLEMGKKIYEKHIAKNEIIIQGDLDERCKKIDELSSEIEAFSLEILECRNKRKCANCSAEIDIDAKFCPKCGAKQEVIEKEEVKEEAQAPAQNENRNEEAPANDEIKEEVKEEAQAPVQNENKNEEAPANDEIKEEVKEETEAPVQSEDSDNTEIQEEKSNLERTVEVESNPQLSEESENKN